MTTYVTGRNGEKLPFNADKINRSIERVTYGLTDPVSKVVQVATDTRLTVYDGITTEQMDLATINAAVQNIVNDIEYDKVAVRLFLKVIYRRVVEDYDHDRDTLKALHAKAFVNFIEREVANSLLDPRMKEKYDLETLSRALDLDRDELFQYAGLSTLEGRYLLKTSKGITMETPQFFFMRVAMGLAYNEANPTEWAIRFYNKMSKLEYVAGGSTNLGAGTNRPALSNCFLLEIHDDMGHIAKSVADVMLLSKGSGGIGASITKMRASGSPLKSTNGISSGPTPFAKIIDTAIRAIMRGGKKKGALCFYMENWHIDFPDFLDWKHNAGDDYLRMRTANTAAFISDEFMKRVRNNAEWYLFDPAEVKDLNELYGRAFSKRYQEYTEKAERGEIRVFKKVPARELYRQMLVALQTTSHPWQTWKDTINLRALNNNTGTIHMSNLCTEICLPQDKDNVAVCNLASLNLAAHIHHREVNWAKLEESVRLAVRQLDNLIDINVLPIPEAEKSDKENRAIGLGVMGFADVIEQLGMAYDSPHAWDFADRIFEFISYMAIDESADLAQARGSYAHFAGSRWSQGMVPVDTLAIMEEERGIPVAVSKESKHKGLDWNLLRAKVKQGMRNATLMAVAPNANIGLVAGTVPGIDARFAQVFSRNKMSGKYLDLNHNLVKDLKNMGIWENVREQIVAHQGDISHINGIPAYIKEVYKTSFTTSPYAYVEVAARAQKWVDQALSRNIYLESRDLDEMMKLYSTAWEKGLKSTYYLHMMPRHTAEQSTVSVNKAQTIGKKGFGALAADVKAEEKQPELVAAVSAPAPAPETAPIPTFVPAQSAPVASAPKGFATVAENVEQVSHGMFENVSPMAEPAPAAPAASVAPAPANSVPASAAIVSAPVPAPAPRGFGAVAPAPASIPAQPVPVAAAPRPVIFDNPADDETLICDSCQ